MESQEFCYSVYTQILEYCNSLKGRLQNMLRIEDTGFHQTGCTVLQGLFDCIVCGKIILSFKFTTVTIIAIIVSINIH